MYWHTEIPFQLQRCLFAAHAGAPKLRSTAKQVLHHAAIHVCSHGQSFFVALSWSKMLPRQIRDWICKIAVSWSSAPEHSDYSFPQEGSFAASPSFECRFSERYPHSLSHLSELDARLLQGACNDVMVCSHCSSCVLEAAMHSLQRLCCPRAAVGREIEVGVSPASYLCLTEASWCV